MWHVGPCCSLAQARSVFGTFYKMAISLVRQQAHSWAGELGLRADHFAEGTGTDLPPAGTMCPWEEEVMVANMWWPPSHPG